MKKERKKKTTMIMLLLLAVLLIFLCVDMACMLSRCEKLVQNTEQVPVSEQK